MVFAGEVEEAVEEEDAELVAERVVVLGGLAGGGFERDGEVAGVGGCDLRRCGEAEDVGGLVLVPKLLVEAFELGVGGEEDFDRAGEADGGAGAVEEAREPEDLLRVGSSARGLLGGSMLIIGGAGHLWAEK